MHSQLDIKMNGRSLVLPDDFSMNVTEENAVFHDVAMHSDPVEVPTEGNRNTLHNADHPLSGHHLSELDNSQAQITIAGLPFRSGAVVVQEDVEVDKTFAFAIDERVQSFDDLIENLECRDVPLKDDILIGEKIGEVTATVTYDAEIAIGLGDGTHIDTGRLRNNTVTIKMEPQALGFSYPGKCQANASGVATLKETRTYPDGTEVKIPVVTKSYINTADEYGANGDHWGAGGAKYCNARVCYKHVGKGTDGKSTGEVAEPTGGTAMYEDHWPYWVLDADRPQSGICFYVRYFLDCLFAHLGVTFDDTALDAVPDLSRLAFFTTHCKYTTKPLAGAPTLSSIEAINNWLSSRGCGGQLKFDLPEQRELDYYSFTGRVARRDESWDLVNFPFVKGQNVVMPSGTTISQKVTWIKSITHNSDSTWFNGTASATVVGMYATNENFPDTSVKTILDSLQNSFGIRFKYDYQMNKVTAYLMRDVFRQRDHQGNVLPVIDLPVTLLSAHPLSSKITGVRMKYSAEGEASEQQRNVRTGKRDYDTDFDYIDYPDDGRVNVDKHYSEIFLNVSSGDMTVYVDLDTGNAYRVKVDKDATTASELRPVMFEVAQYKGIEVGDCSEQNDDNVREFISDFQPVSFNDVNFQTERNAYTVTGTATQNSSSASYTGGNADAKPLLAAYVDEEMEPEFTESSIRTAVTPALYDIYVSQVLKLIESYDPSKTDDGNSPLQSYDWGLAVAMMRGGGSDATVQQYAFGYDGFGNDKWRTVSGEYVMASDTMDAMGNVFDYDGTDPGIGTEERFSLKIRAYKPFVYYKKNGVTRVSMDTSLAGKPVEGETGLTWLIPVTSDIAVMQRGLADTFMAEHFWFLLHCRPLRLHCLATPAALLDIPNHWANRFRIGEYVGYIDKLSYVVDKEKGIRDVVIDFFAI